MSQTVAIGPSPNAHRSCFLKKHFSKMSRFFFLQNTGVIDTLIPVVQNLDYWNDTYVVILLLSVYKTIGILQDYFKASTVGIS